MIGQIGDRPTQATASLPMLSTALVSPVAVWASYRVTFFVPFTSPARHP